MTRPVGVVCGAQQRMSRFRSYALHQYDVLRSHQQALLELIVRMIFVLARARYFIDWFIRNMIRCGLRLATTVTIATNLFSQGMVAAWLFMLQTMKAPITIAQQKFMSQTEGMYMTLLKYYGCFPSIY